MLRTLLLSAAAALTLGAVVAAPAQAAPTDQVTSEDWPSAEALPQTDALRQAQGTVRQAQGTVRQAQGTAKIPKKVLPVVDMGAVGTAAFVEGFRGNQVALGDDASTVLVQQALTARGFPVTADGRYTRATTKAYASFQRSLGYRGIDANGIPGPTSLAALGTSRFTIVNPVDVGSRSDRYGSKRVNTRTKQMLGAADVMVPWKITVTQGSYCVLEKSGCAKASAGTHDGGGSIDIKASGLTSTQRWQTVQALRAVGFAAWLRTPGQCGGCWPTHIHAVAIGDTDMWQKNGKTINRDQVGDYFLGRNGLADHKADNTPVKYRVPFVTWEQFVVSAP